MIVAVMWERWHYLIRAESMGDFAGFP